MTLVVYFQKLLSSHFKQPKRKEGGGGREVKSYLCGSTVAMDDVGVDTTQVVALSQGRSRHLPQTWVPGRPVPPGGTECKRRRASERARRRPSWGRR